MTSGLPNEADATVYETPDVPLVTGISSELRVFRDRLVVTAESAGTSLLVLPLEFSHCLDLRVTSGAPVRLLRANINQAALLLSGRSQSRSFGIATRLGISDVAYTTSKMRVPCSCPMSDGRTDRWAEPLLRCNHA